MALLAAATEAPVMNIISLMTGVAFRAHHCTQRFGVTRFAVEIAMPTIKHEFRATVVVKLPRKPRSSDVARFAFVAQRAFMDVLFFVTTHTGFRRFAVARGRMARLTRRGSVSAGQWKLCLVVIEEGFRPLCVSVTRYAVLA